MLVELYRTSTNSCYCATSNARIPCLYYRPCLSLTCYLDSRSVRLPRTCAEGAQSNKSRACKRFCNTSNPGRSKSARPLGVPFLRALPKHRPESAQLRPPIQPSGGSSQNLRPYLWKQAIEQLNLSMTCDMRDIATTKVVAPAYAAMLTAPSSL